MTGVTDWSFLVAALLIAMAVSVATLATVSLLRIDRLTHGPASRRFCRRLGLSGAQRRLVTRVAQRSGAPGPGSLLVSRGYFDTAVDLYAAPGEQGRRLAAIRKKVFG